MKKTSVVLIMLVGSIAFASSLSIPWYVDNAPQDTALPPTKDGTLALLYLKSTVDRVLTCEIAYYNAEGAFLGPLAPNNTFSIQPKAALGFRPVADDPILGLTSPYGAVGTAGGQEGPVGVTVPNRPRSANSTAVITGSNPQVVDVKKNGSVTISWFGVGAEPTDLQGSQQSWSKGGTTVVSFSHLLPPGK
jgi:hypothetical protein